MKNLLIFLLPFIYLGSANQAIAQKYFVYDCSEFSVMFVCPDDNSKINEVQFSAKNSEGEWKWNTFEVYDFYDLDNPDEDLKYDLDSLEYEKGFIYLVKDNSNKKFSIDYYRTSDYLIVTPINEDGTYATNSWTLNRRSGN